MASTASATEPQQKRSWETRRKLLDATVECVAEYGYAGASMDRIVERAGVSRGAQGHHFPTKNLLIQAAFAHMLDGMIEDLRRQTEMIRERHSDPATVFRHLWNVYFSGRLFAVTTEFIAASRTDEDLRQALIPVSERFHQQVDDCFYILNRGSDYEDPQLRMAVNLTMSLLRGMGVQTYLYDHPDHYREMLDFWLSILGRVLEPGRQDA